MSVGNFPGDRHRRLPRRLAALNTWIFKSAMIVFRLSCHAEWMKRATPAAGGPTAGQLRQNE
jgi:hypothetical protein